MASTRALFASIGVSVALVAAAALSLFAVSVLIAFGGWSAGMGGSEPATTLVFAGTATAPAAAAQAPERLAPVVLHRAPASHPRRPATLVPPADARLAGGGHAQVISQPAGIVSHRPAAPQPVVAAPPPAAHIPARGDGVRRVGDGLSSTAQSTGKALADVTAPLGPPISAAVQKVLDLVAVLLRRTTNGLGGTLDKVGQP